MPKVNVEKPLNQVTQLLPCSALCSTGLWLALRLQTLSNTERQHSSTRTRPAKKAKTDKKGKKSTSTHASSSQKCTGHFFTCEQFTFKCCTKCMYTLSVWSKSSVCTLDGVRCTSFPFRTASNPASQGGLRFQQYWPTWQGQGVSPYVVPILISGSVLQFVQHPPLTRQPVPVPVYCLLSQRMAMEEATVSLLTKGVIVQVQKPRSLDYYRHLFLVPQQTSGWRPILDLSRLSSSGGREISQGDPRVYQKDSAASRVGVFDVFTRCLLPHFYPLIQLEISQL